MTDRIVRRPRVARIAGIALAALAGAGAQAMTVSYQCVGYRPLTAEFTPRQAQIHFEGGNWTVYRVRDAAEARYANSRVGVIVVTKNQVLTLTHGSETLACKFLPDGVAPAKPPLKMPAPGSSAPVGR